VPARLSVIIPTYNRARLVETSVRSILERQLSTEVIVVDDGSTDETEAVVRSIGRDVLYVRQANAGPAAARNRGFAASRAPYVTFLDSDDEWLPNGPERLIGQLDRHSEVDLVFADAAMGARDAGVTSFVECYGGPEFRELPGTYPESGLKVLDRWPFFRRLVRRNVMFLGSLVIRRDTFTRVGPFDPTLRGAADWEWFMRATVRSAVAFSDGPATSLYYKHSEGMSTDSSHMHEDFIAALAAVAGQNDVPPEMRRYVRAEWKRHTFEWGYRAYGEGALVEARRRWLRALATSGFTLRTLAYLAAACFPESVVHRARHIKRRFAA
jgi:glycosyltransferase involved in cell wall biosynthesis